MSHSPAGAPTARPSTPDSSDRESPAPSRPWRSALTTLGSADDEIPHKDKNYRKYASNVERALSLFDTALQEWADYISFLNRLLKALQGRPGNVTAIPAKATVAKRLAQCLNPSLPSGVHQKALEVYTYVFSVIGRDGLSRDLALYLPGLAPVLSFASLSVRAPFLDLLERYLVDLDPRALRPAMKSIILALLPGLEEETSEDFDRTLRLVERFKASIRPSTTNAITEVHWTGDDFFWQCFFLAGITGSSRRPGALAYLTRCLPRLGQPYHATGEQISQDEVETAARLAELVTSPEPGLLIRCFSAGLADEQLLIQRGFLDLLVTHLPLHSEILQRKAKPGDLELLLRAAVGVTVRRDMSLNRRLWTWLLGPEPPVEGHGEGAATAESPSHPGAAAQGYLASRTEYFEKFGLQPLTRALLSMIRSNEKDANPTERARPYKICLSLMDRWEIGGLVVPELFLPIVDSVRAFKGRAANKADFAEVLRSASVFFDGVESGLIYSEMLTLMAQAIGPGELSEGERSAKLDLVRFMLKHFNVREEDMVTIHAPLLVLAVLGMIEEAEDLAPTLVEEALNITSSLLDMVPERAFTSKTEATATSTPEIPSLLDKIRSFYLSDQGNLDVSPSPFPPALLSSLLLAKASSLVCTSLRSPSNPQISLRTRIITQAITKSPSTTPLNTPTLLQSLYDSLSSPTTIPFPTYTSIILLSSTLYSVSRINLTSLSELVSPLVRHAWAFLSPSDPKYHVEVVRSLWALQTALGKDNRDIEAAICSLMIQGEVMNGTFCRREAERGRRFCVLWNMTLQDYGSSVGSEKKGKGESKGGRLTGAENYEVMLTRPMFLMLDALAEEKAQLFMTVKGWLGGMVGVEKMFTIFVSKFASISFLRRRQLGPSACPTPFAEDDDLDMALYYIRSLSSVFRWAPEGIWTVLAKRLVKSDAYQPPLSEITGTQADIPLQEFFLHVALACLAHDPPTTPLSDGATDTPPTQLHRASLTLLHQILLSPYAEPLARLRLDTILLDKLAHALAVGTDPHVQVLLLDVVYASLKLRELAPSSGTKENEASDGALHEKKAAAAAGDVGRGSRGSLSGVVVPSDKAPPANLLKCILTGLGASSSRPVLDSWVGFLTACLPMYEGGIFQVVIPLVETLCREIGNTFSHLQKLFSVNHSHQHNGGQAGPETTLISLLNGLEQVLAHAHDRLLTEEAKAQVTKHPEQAQGFFGNMVSGVFSSEGSSSSSTNLTSSGGGSGGAQGRSATANDRLTVLLAFQDAVRICFTIWSWGHPGQGQGKGVDMTSAASLNYTSLRMRNRARRLLEHLFAAETLECLETAIHIWRTTLESPDPSLASEVFRLLPALDGSRPKHTVPALFNAIYSRSNPSALDPSRRSTLTIDLADVDLAVFLVDYIRELEDDTMDEIWGDCMAFLRDLLGNPFPHRATLPCLLEFAAVIGEKVDNTRFGEEKRMRRELADLFLRLLTAIFTTRPISFSDIPDSSKRPLSPPTRTTSSPRLPQDRADDVVGILASIVPSLPKILVEPDRVLAAASSISSNVLAPALRSKSFPDTFNRSALSLLHELSRLPLPGSSSSSGSGSSAGQKAPWRKDVSDAFNDPRFFSLRPLSLIPSSILPLIRQWCANDKERMPELLSRLTPPSTAGIVFGVGATSARLEADRKTQLNLRRIATLVLACPVDTFVSDLPALIEKLTELLTATATSSPSSTTRSDIYLLLRALILRISAVHLAPLWPVLNAELHAALAAVVAPDHSVAADTYGCAALLGAAKLLDLLVCVAPEGWQVHEWLFVTDTIDAVYRAEGNGRLVAMVDEVCEELGAVSIPFRDGEVQTQTVGGISGARRPLLGTPGGISDEVGLERKDELVAKVLRPFFGQLSIYAFESTYAMGQVDVEACVEGLVKDVFDERTIVRAL